MVTRIQVVEEARTWVATPYAWQQRIKGVGVDCDNFALAVFADSGAVAVAEGPRGRGASGLLFAEILETRADYVPSLAGAALADVVLFHAPRKAGEVRHVAIVSRLEPYLKIVEAGARMVTEHRVNAFIASTIHSIWRLRGLEA